jgi:hypothetical protein
MKVHEILIEAPKDPKGVVFEIFVKMLPDEITKASLKQVDDALRWLAKTAKSNPTVAEDIASSLVAGSKQMGISVREMAQMAEPHLLRVGIDPADIQRAKSIAEKLAEPSMWQKFKNAIGVGAKKDPKVEPTKIEPTMNPPTTPPPTTPPTTAPTTTPPVTPTTTPPVTPTTTAPSVPSRIAAAEAGSAIRKFDPRLWNWWQTADAIAMAYGVIEPWYTFKQRADKAIEEFAAQTKNPDGSLKWKDKDTLSKGVQIAAQEAMAQMGALLAGRRLIGFFSGVNKLRALPNKTREEIDAIYAKLGAKGQIAFAAWLDTPPGRKAFDGWLWGQMYDQQGPEDERPPLAASVNSIQGQIAWALRQVSSYSGGLVKSFYDDARRSAGQIDSQGNDAAAATQKQQAAKGSLPNGGGVLNTTTER